MKVRAIALLSLCASCPASQQFPGSELIGTFNFTASPLSNNCLFAEIPDGGFTFSGTFSHNPGGAAWFTVGRINRDAGFDGQYVVSEASAPRQFVECQCGSNTQVDETLAVALLSPTQQAAADGGCPPNPLDGGVPVPNGSVLAPMFRGSRYDAVLACGELVETVTPADPTCQCSACTAVFGLEGATP